MDDASGGRATVRRPMWSASGEKAICRDGTALPLAHRMRAARRFAPRTGPRLGSQDWGSASPSSLV